MDNVQLHSEYTDFAGQFKTAVKKSQGIVKPKFNVASILVVGGLLGKDLMDGVLPSSKDDEKLSSIDSSYVSEFASKMVKLSIQFDSNVSVRISNIKYEGDFLTEHHSTDLLVLADINKNTGGLGNNHLESDLAKSPDAWKSAISVSNPKIIALATDNALSVGSNDIPSNYDLLTCSVGNRSLSKILYIRNDLL